MIHIDGSCGEGGGQVLRTSLGLSLVTGKPFTIENIRARRKMPGLMRQHLTAVNAAAAVGGTHVEGASLGSRTLVFEPSTVRAGSYHFAVGTAGSATLVLQTVLPALLVAAGASDLTLEGGTHNPFAPPFDFLQKSFLPLLGRMGAEVKATLERPGFYPAGGGRFHVHVEPCPRLTPIELLERGAIVATRARAVVAQISEGIAQREIEVVRNMLGWPRHGVDVEVVENSFGPGNVLLLEVETENVTEVVTGFGEKGVRAEEVARKAVRDVRKYLAADVPVGLYLADQLLIPMAMAGGGRFRTSKLTRHTETNIEIVRRFLDIDITVETTQTGAQEIALTRRA